MGFWDTSFAKEKWGIENGYDDVVQYPLGYGLSYTDFEWTVTNCNYSGGSTLDKDGTIEVTVSVENKGDTTGRDVVQLYYTPPYTSGGIEKSAVTLGAFAKTATRTGRDRTGHSRTARGKNGVLRLLRPQQQRLYGL